MVDGAVPGDTVSAEIVKDRGRFVEAGAARIEQPSPDRRAPVCPIQSDCGGCPLMVVDESIQRLAKRRILLDALERIGRLEVDFPVAEVVPIPPELHYRNKIELTFGRDSSGRTVLGYHRARRPSELVDVADCLIADPSLEPLLATAREFFLEGPGSSDPAVHEGREALRLVLRASTGSNERLVAFRGLPGPFPSIARFAAAAAADPGLVGVVRILGSPDRRGGAITETIFGRPWIREEFEGITFQLPAQTFFQVHRAASLSLVEHILAGAGAPDRVLELYGGVGVLGLAIARRGSGATIVDADPLAIACGRQAAAAAGLRNVGFERADVHDFLHRRAGQAPPDLVIADPPRTGLGRGVVPLLSALGPKRLAMVSCDPATLARDLAALSEAGYRIERIVPFDLFPQTAHLETVVWLAR